MIEIASLREADKGRKVVYRWSEEGVITSWNDRFIFVRFKGPNGAACRPEDITYSADLDDWRDKMKGAGDE